MFVKWIHVLISQLDFFFYFEGSSPWKIRPLPVNNAKVGKYKRQQERKRMESEIIIREK